MINDMNNPENSCIHEIQTVADDVLINHSKTNKIIDCVQKLERKLMHMQVYFNWGKFILSGINMPTKSITIQAQDGRQHRLVETKNPYYLGAPVGIQRRAKQETRNDIMLQIRTILNMRIHPTSASEWMNTIINVELSGPTAATPTSAAPNATHGSAAATAAAHARAT
eukprot:NODE_778_length_793_cov_1594.939516_g516_i0.p1 GENE.NODE_778_length_793_cov_1594.939516_g516_i0~~NODE_778_length_793_cov_1594.939516_g516_i0.p1  ORF type:complete len:168 (+),score=0.10 NODE_778_length_793_cov_1594.939516_g516_i0:105-608(+)